MNNLFIANKIVVARKAKGLSQAALAQQLSVTAQAVSKWECGDSLPDIVTLTALAQIVGVDLNYFAEMDQATPSSSHRAKDMSVSVWQDADFSNLTNIGEKFSFSNIISCVFANADLSKATLKRNNIKNCNLNNANLSNCLISGSNIIECNLNDANLLNAQIAYSNITNSCLNNADLTNAIIKGSRIANTQFANATLNNTQFTGTAFKDVALNGTIANCQFVNTDCRTITFLNVHFCNTMFKNSKLNRSVFQNCTADTISYAFLKSANAPLKNITLAP